MTGRDKCRLLRNIRAVVALENGIELKQEECHHEGDCAGTCPKCEAEAENLMASLEALREKGRVLKLSGVCLLPEEDVDIPDFPPLAPIDWNVPPSGEDVPKPEVGDPPGDLMGDVRALPRDLMGWEGTDFLDDLFNDY